MTEQLGKLLLGVGVLTAVIGLVLMFSSKISWLKLGHLPGDIHIERHGFALFVPITTMLLLSGLLSAIFYLLGRLQR